MGWNEVVQEMVTVFRSEDDGATASFLSIGQQASSLGDLLGNVERTYGTVMRAINTMQPMLAGAIQMGAARQELELTIAGTLRAYNAAGEAMESINRRFHAGTQEWTDAVTAGFATARTVGQSTLAQIASDAALLPGEAQDYVQGLQVTLPAMLAASSTRSLRSLVELQNRFIATGLVNQIDAPQAGRDLMRLVQGGAGMDVRTWTTLQSLFHNPGRDTWANLHGAALDRARAADPSGAHRFAGGRQAPITAAQFNHLTGEQRVEAIRQALESYRPLLDQMGNTWSAQMGAFNSMVDTIKRVIAAPIFEPALRFLGQINHSLENAQGNLQIIGSYFSGYIGRAIDAMVPKVEELYQATTAWLQGIVNSPAFHHIFSRLEGIGNMFGDVLGSLAGSSTGQSGILGAIFGPLGGAFSSMIQNPKMMQAFDILANVAQWVVVQLGSIGMISGQLHEGLGGLLASGVLLFAQALEWAVSMVPFVVNAMSEMWDLTKMALTPLWAAIQFGVALLGGGTGLRGTLSFLVQMVVTVAQLLGAAFLMVVFFIGLVISPLIMLGTILFRLAKWISDTFHLFGDPAQFNPAAAMGQGLETWLADLQALMHAGKRDKGPTDTNRTSTARHPQVHNDFRFSRFDITQKFAEGFDPDRVATAFVTDLQAMAETPLSSGFLPAFSSG